MAEEEKKEEKKKVVTIYIPPINLWMVATIILAVALVFVYLKGFPTTGMFVGVSSQDAANKAVNYINKNLVQSGSVTLLSVNEMSGIYKVVTSYQGQNISVYVTKDGKYLVIIGSGIFDMTQEVPTAPASTQEIPKTGKPTVELYIFSYCPAGTAALDSYAIVGKLLGSKADMRVKFFSNMHGDHELQQNEIQECIQESEPSKYWDYASKYVQEVYNKCGATRDVNCDKNESMNLMQKVGIDSEKIMMCVKEKGETLYSNDKNDASKFNLQYSPSIVVNDVSLGSDFDRTPEGIKNLICSGFTTAPAECNQTLSSAGSSQSSGGCQ
jgi:protein-disulfide isomerase